MPSGLDPLPGTPTSSSAQLIGALAAKLVAGDQNRAAEISEAIKGPDVRSVFAQPAPPDFKGVVAALARSMAGGDQLNANLLAAIKAVAQPSPSSSPVKLMRLGEIAAPTRVYPTLQDHFRDPRPPAPRRRQVVRRVQPGEIQTAEPPGVGGVLAAERAQSYRQAAIGLLIAAGLGEEREHFEAVEGLLYDKSAPARSHAALSIRLVLTGVADHVHPASDERRPDRHGRPREVGHPNTGNRLIAFVESRWDFTLERDTDEFGVFIATVTALTNFGGRGPHRIRSSIEPSHYFLYLLQVMGMVARAYRA